MVRRAYVHLGAGLLAYGLMIFVSARLLVHFPPGQPIRVAIALLPMLPCGFIAWGIVRALKRMDEYQRKIQFDSLLIAAAATIWITFSYGFLEGIGFPRLSMFWVWPVFGTIWAGATIVRTLTLRQA